MTPPPAPRGPDLRADKIFATRGVVELGGSLDFSAQRDFDNAATWMNLGLDAYVGYFVAKYFTLGLYLSMRFSQYSTDESRSWSVAPGLLLAPGVAIRLMRRAFFYGDVLVGLYGAKALHGDFSSSRDSDIYGVVGAETGVKLRLAGRLLLKLGVRLTYDVGQRSTDLGTGPTDSDISRFTFLFRVGFSGFL